MIVASAVVIAFALTAVSGITYSWFSDTDKTEITVTTGTIDVKSEVNSTGIELKMIGANETAYDNSDSNFNVSAITDSSGISITVENILPGYQAWIPIKIWNGGKNQAQIMVSANAVKDNDGSTAGELYYSLLQNDKTTAVKMNKFAAYDTERYVVGAEDKYGYIKIAMDSALTGQTEATYKVTVKTDAVQINAPTDAVMEGLTLTNTGSTQIIPTNSQASTIDVILAEEKSISNVTLKTVSTGEKGSYTITSDEKDSTIIGGIQVTSANEESKTALTTAKATLTFVFDGDLSGTALYATHVPSSGEGTMTAAIESSNVVYDDATDKTTVTVDTTGFSTWYVSADANAIVDGKYMKLTIEAYTPQGESKETTVIDYVMSTAKSVIMLDDMIFDTQFILGVESENIVWNLNGHKIKFTANADNAPGVAIVGNVTIIGTEPGSGMETNSKYLFNFFKNGVTFTVDGGEYIAKNIVINCGISYGGTTVNIEGGTFRATEVSDKSIVIDYQGGTLNVNGGAFYCEYQACINCFKSTTTINGGSFTSTRFAVDQSYGTLTINDGTFIGRSADVYELVLINCNAATNTINGGTFIIESTGSEDAYIFGFGDDVTTSVNGGSFEMLKGADATGSLSFAKLDSGLYSTEGGKIILDNSAKVLSGGTYGFNPSEVSLTIVNITDVVSFVADGYQSSSDSNGKWVVKK